MIQQVSDILFCFFIFWIILLSLAIQRVTKLTMGGFMIFQLYDGAKVILMQVL